MPDRIRSDLKNLINPSEKKKKETFLICSNTNRHDAASVENFC